MRQERIAEYQARQAEQAKQREEVRIRRNSIYDSRGVSSFQREGPGFKAYKWIRNLKGDDGNYYAEHVSVTGRKKKVYSLSEQKEMEDRSSTRWECYNCNTESENGMTGVQNKCPNCGHEQYISYAYYN